MIFRAKTVSVAVVVLCAVCASGAAVSAQCRATAKQAAKPNRVIETANFRIYGIGGSSEASRLANDFESLRAELARTWLGEKKLPTWSPKCEVRIHATANAYSRAVGQDQFATVGASRVDLTGRRISLRRIDIRADQAGWFAAALPHELTHVIMADEFLGRELPIWADEGMAVLADSPSKQSLHLRDFQAGRANGTDFRLADLMGHSCCPAATRIPIFYGQSLSLVRFLVHRKSPAEFVGFLHRVEQVGYEAAIAETYGFGGAGELERRWLQAADAASQPLNLLVSATGSSQAAQLTE